MTATGKPYSAASLTLVDRWPPLNFQPYFFFKQALQTRRVVGTRCNHAPAPAKEAFDMIIQHYQDTEKTIS